MKKTIRAIVALIATLGMALAGFVGASTALANDANNTSTTVKITGAKTGDEYVGYRLLNATAATTGTGEEAKTNITYTVNPTYASTLKQALVDLQVVLGENGSPVTDATAITDSDVITYLAGLTTDSDDLKAFAAEVGSALTGTPELTATAATNGTVSWSNAPYGYYLFKQTAKDETSTVESFLHS